MKSTRLNPFQVFRDQWAIMSLYERFEQVVAFVLSAVIAVIIDRGVAVPAHRHRLHAAGPRCLQSPGSQGIPECVRHDHDALDRDGVQAFHCSRGAASGQHHPGQDRDPHRPDRAGAQVRDPDPEASPAKIAALAGATLALGATYWLLRKRGDRAAETSE